MPLPYDPRDAVQVWPVGEYDAVLHFVKDTMTKEKPGKPSKPMQEWQFEVYNSEGLKMIVTDRVTREVAWKLKKLAQAIGREIEFEAGTFQADDHVGSNLRLALKIEQSPGYDDKNGIAKYLPPAAPTRTAAEKILNAPAKPRPDVQTTSSEKDEDIPF